MSPHILVVKDSPQMLRSISMILEGYGYSVTPTGTGERCIEEFERHHPDVVLLDLMLPGMDRL